MRFGKHRESVELVGRAGASYDGYKARYLNSFWLHLEPYDQAFTPHWRDGFWEAWITAWMDAELDFCDIFIDVGANVGYYTFLAATAGIPVVAFEPQSHLANLLNKSELYNKTGLVDIRQEALSDEYGTVEISVPTGHSGAASIMGPVGDDSRREEVTTVTFDDAVYATAPRGHFWLIKIDAEGAEPKIWKGMENFRREADWTIIMEWAPARYDDPRQFADDLLRYDVTVVDTTGNEQPVTKDSLLAVQDFEMIVVRNNAI